VGLGVCERESRSPMCERQARASRGRGASV
jgi:hypothetical protein